MRLTDLQIQKIKNSILLGNGDSIVRINVSNKSDGWTNDESNYNIYCIDTKNNIIWQVKELKTKPSGLFGEADPFYSLKKSDEGSILAYRFSGYEYSINAETGEASRIGFHK
mgnify:CR=1 FL=1